MAAQSLIRDAMNLPNGARFFKCALQVNPFPYLTRHKKPTTFKDEASYNQAIVQACKDQGVQVIAVTDHYRVRTGDSLRRAATDAGIVAFPGFEAVTKDGVHVLCLFGPDRPVDEVDRVIGECGIHDFKATSPAGEKDFTELLDLSHQRGCVCIAAHVTTNGGLLAKLSGQPRVVAWKHPKLFACSIGGSLGNVDEGLKTIIANGDPAHHRDRPIAVLNAQDVWSPEDVAKPGSTCWIKMCEVSVEGLRQAFLDPDSRVRLHAHPPPEEHAEFLAITWQGGFLDGAAIHFNENLNVLIGGRGAGKSTVVESIRYVLGLEPVSEDARRAHEGIMRQVLGSGTKVSLFVQSHRPARKRYLIERTVPNPPVVRDDENGVLTISPTEVLPRVEVYGQHEISELSKSREKLTRLLDRFVDRDADLSRRRADLSRQLERSRSRLLEAFRERQQTIERLAALPGLEETLKRFKDAGLEDRLKEQSILLREERIFKAAAERLDALRGSIDTIRRSLPIDRTFVSPKATAELSARDTLAKVDAILERASAAAEGGFAQLLGQLDAAGAELRSVRGEWDVRRAQVLGDYERILRGLQKSKVDGEEFMRLRRQIEDLRPLKDRSEALERELDELQTQRRNLTTEWEELKAQEFRVLSDAARRVSQKLQGRVKVQVYFSGNREPLAALLRDRVGGRMAETCDALLTRAELSIPELVQAWRTGRDELVKRFGIPVGQADRLVTAPPEVQYLVEELDLPSTTQIELNTAPDGEPPQWQTLEQLSTGQKATAVLLLLLLESEAPLVVDQPEDDLDNRFITEGVVPKMREEKRRRQFLFSTHNANIPVLGDAELIVGLVAAGDAEGSGKGRVPTEYMGSIDSVAVRVLVEEILEGGKTAFEMRRMKYGF